MANNGASLRYPTCAGPGRRRERGFTLLELMIVVIVISILAVLAMSSYNFANVKARRNAANGCLTQASQYMERYYTTKMSYNDTVTPDPPLPPTDICDDEVERFYTLSLANNSSTYTVTAVPTASQKDGKCGTLTLDQAGTRTPTTEGCW